MRSSNADRRNKESSAVALQAPAESMQMPVYLPEDAHCSDSLNSLIDGLQLLLKKPAYDFWCYCMYDTSVHKCVATMLQFVPRAHDTRYKLDHRCFQLLQEACKRVFALFYRLICADEESSGAPGATQRANLIRNHSAVTFASLVDIAALFEQTNPSKSAELIQAAVQLQPKLIADAHTTAHVVANNLAAVHEEVAFGISNTGASSSARTGAGTVLHPADAVAYFTDACYSLASIARCSSDIACSLVDGSDKRLLALVPLLYDAGHAMLSTTDGAHLLPDAAADLAASMILHGPVKKVWSFDSIKECVAYVTEHEQLIRDCNRLHAFASCIRDTFGETKAREMLGSAACPTVQKAHQHAEAVDDATVAQLREVVPHIDAPSVRRCIAESGGDAEKALDNLLEGKFTPDKTGRDSNIDDRSSRMSALSQLAYDQSSASSGTATALSTYKQPLKQPTGVSGGGVRSRADDTTALELDWRSESEKKHSRTLAIASEYDDEHDDTFDDEASTALEPSAEIEDATAFESTANRAGKDPAQGGSSSKQTFYVMDGKVYNSKREGAEKITARSASEASAIVQKREREEAEKIHGLAEGGNKATFHEELESDADGGAHSLSADSRKADGNGDENQRISSSRGIGRQNRGRAGRSANAEGHRSRAGGARGRRKQAHHAKDSTNPGQI